MMTDMGKGKKQKLGDKSPEHVDDVQLLHSIEKLQEIQDQLEKINEQASDEVLEIEQRYINMREPVYDQRKEIIRPIPDFWLTAFLSHPALSQLLTDQDQKIFKYLESLDVEESKDVKLGYTISFNFKPNPYFEDSKLSKTFNFLDEGTIKVTCTSVKWKEGMGISSGESNEKKRNRQHLEEESFFSWFEENEDMDEMTDEIAEIIKEDLWPNPLSYFNIEGDHEDSDGDEYDDEDKDNVDEESEDIDDDDDQN